MHSFDKLFFDIFEIPYISLVANERKVAVHPDYIDRVNKLPSNEQYNKLLEFAESLLLIEDASFTHLEDDIINILRNQESKAGKAYSEKIYNMLPKVIKELKRKYPEKIEVEKTEEEKQIEREQIKEVYEDIKSKEGVPDLDWPEQFKKMVDKSSSRIPNKYLQILNYRY